MKYPKYFLQEKPSQINQIIEEGKIKGAIDSVPIEKLEKILYQMKNCVCKVIGIKVGTGFFCKIFYQNKLIPVLMTNFHIITEEYLNENKEITVSKNDDKQYREETENENTHPFYSGNDENKYEKNINFKDNTVSLVTDSKEYEYITKLKGLKIPNGQDYKCIDKDGHVVLEKHHSIPLLFKCLSYKCLNGYDDNNQSKYSIFIYNQNNIPQYFINVNIIKVFPIIDFEFYFNVEEKKLSQIKFYNPFKNDTSKSQKLLRTHHFINSIDKNSDIYIKLDPLTNDFFFNFNNITNLADNQINLN